MNTPIFSKLIKYHAENRISFAMPGHKNGRGLPENIIKCDVTELDTTVDLRHGCAETEKAHAMLCELYKSRESKIVTEGSSAAIRAMLASVLKPGETLLASADCHLSVVSACAVCGFNMRLFEKNDNLDDILNTFNDIKAVIVTSPSYYGVCRDISAISRICHEHGIVLLTDEAHGAHFPAHSRFPDSAVKLGADIVCQSAHKTLNALTGAAYLHLCGDFADADRLWSALDAFTSTSPSYVIAASADAARAELSDSDKWDGLFEMCQRFKKEVLLNTNIAFLKNDDFSRLVLDFSYYDTSGFEVYEILSKKYGIDAEMADDKKVVMITSVSNTQEDFSKMLSAVTEITKDLKKCESPRYFSEPPACKSLIKPYEAFYAKSEEVPLLQAEGRRAKSIVTPYPPGIPIIMTGGIITAEQIEYIRKALKRGAKITGLNKGSVQCVKDGV